MNVGSIYPRPLRLGQVGLHRRLENAEQRKRQPRKENSAGSKANRALQKLSAIIAELTSLLESSGQGDLHAEFAEGLKSRVAELQTHYSALIEGNEFDDLIAEINNQEKSDFSTIKANLDRFAEARAALDSMSLQELSELKTLIAETQKLLAKNSLVNLRWEA